MTSRYDLHCHSTASDGTLTPQQLIPRARERGVEYLALTDHDTTAGLAVAAEAAASCGLRLIPGVEVSVTWNRRTVHIVGLNIDPTDAALQAGLAGLREFRDGRAEEIARRLERAGIPGALEGARRHARGAIVGRTHFAHFLVDAGRAPNVRDVFKKYLVKDTPGYVSGDWAELEEAVAWIRGAGGHAVIAHPARYRLTATKLRELIGQFRECGGAALEVVTGSHSRDECHAMAAQVRRSDLYASCGSDYHGPENPWIDLGSLPQLPAGCRPIWEHPEWPLPEPAAAPRRAL